MYYPIVCYNRNQGYHIIYFIYNFVIKIEGERATTLTANMIAQSTKRIQCEEFTNFLGTGNIIVTITRTSRPCDGVCKDNCELDEVVIGFRPTMGTTRRALLYILSLPLQHEAAERLRSICPNANISVIYPTSDCEF